MSLLQSRFLRNIAALQAGGALFSGMNFASGVVLAYVLGASRQGAWIVSVQLYSLAFFQGAKSFSVNCAMMHKNVFATFLLNKPKTF